MQAGPGQVSQNYRRWQHRTLLLGNAGRKHLNLLPQSLNLKVNLG